MFVARVCRLENLAVNEATLNLKDGRSQTVGMPAGLDLHNILYYMRVPADAAGKTVRLLVPGGEAIDVPAGDIASLEVAPPYALIPDFMTEAELGQVLAFTMARADTFQDSGVHRADDRASTTGYGIRRSRVLEGQANAALAALMMPKLRELMPKLWPRLRIDPMPLSKLECQITAHGDGDFFATHTDNGTPEIAHRRMSYVYYFHREPKQFSGGHLCLYNLLIQGDGDKCGALAVEIDPPRNGVIIFPTFLYHKVTPIQCASSALTDQRLTLNGWLF